MEVEEDENTVAPDVSQDLLASAATLIRDGEQTAAGMAESARTRRVPGARATAWVVSLQPRTTRPAVCRACHQFFNEGDVRVCTRADRTYGRYLHTECIPGGLRANMEFAPDSQEDTMACRQLNEQVRRLSSTGQLEPEHLIDGQVALVPPTLEGPLPSGSWFQHLTWQHLRSLPGGTFVQVPKRMEEAFSDAVGVALREIGCVDDAQRQLAGWKAFLLLPWLLLFRPPAVQESLSCAELLSERLDRF